MPCVPAGMGKINIFQCYNVHTSICRQAFEDRCRQGQEGDERGASRQQPKLRPAVQAASAAMEAARPRCLFLFLFNFRDGCRSPSLQWPFFSSFRVALLQRGPTAAHTCTAKARRQRVQTAPLPALPRGQQTTNHYLCRKNHAKKENQPLKKKIPNNKDRNPGATHPPKVDSPHHATAFAVDPVAVHHLDGGPMAQADGGGRLLMPPPHRHRQRLRVKQRLARNVERLHELHNVYVHSRPSPWYLVVPSASFVRPQSCCS